MPIETMANPLETIKKFKNRSWKEIRTRGEQAISAKSEQIGLSGKLPTDQEFWKLFDKSQFAAETPISAEAVYENFRENAEFSFFPAFCQKKNTLEIYRRFFGEQAAPVTIEKAERIIEGRFDLLGFSDLNFGAEVDWHLEPISGKRSPLKHWKQFDELDAEETGDKKIIWELNRHQHFFTLGAAFWLTNDERYAETFARHLESWMEQNPPGTGINWFSSLEIAFRAMSWIWAFNFFKDSQSVTPEIFCKALKHLYLHGRHIEKHLSTYYSPNTHLTGEALGLYYLGTQLPFLLRANHWRKTGERILTGELDRQILKDGVYFEQTTWYQRYTTDFYTHFLILKTLAGKDDADASSAETLEKRLQSSLDFLMYITRPDGTTPIIGDDDGGRMLPLANAKFDDFRGTLAVGAVLFERGDYKCVAGKVSEEIAWLLGLEGVQAFIDLAKQIPEKNSLAFETGGYFVMRDGWADTDNYMLIDCGEVGALSGGHGHADTLSINLAMQGKTLLADSGTYTYHESSEQRDYFRSTAAHNTLTIDEISSSKP
ncbi:MAG TPA: alginate lyase family protein, partial [Pyrinomonadaceae bacterium]